MPDWIIFIFVVCCGFTVSGIAGATLRLVAGSDPRFRVSKSGVAGIFGALLVFMIAGPYMVVSAAMRSWTAGALPVLGLLMAGGLATAWSFCSGVFVVQALLLAGLVSV